MAHVLTIDSEELHLHALVENARENGWTLSYESHDGQYVGIARRGKVFLEATGESIVAAIWSVLQKTNQFPIGEA